MKLYANIICNLSVIDTDRRTNKIYQYDESASQWKEVGKIDRRRNWAGIAFMNDTIYVTGGHESDILD